MIANAPLQTHDKTGWRKLRMDIESQVSYKNKTPIQSRNHLNLTSDVYLGKNSFKKSP